MEVIISHHQHNFDTKIWGERKISSGPHRGDDDDMTINFNFSNEIIVRESLLQEEDGPEEITHEESNTFISTLHLSRQQCFDFESAQETIKNKLINDNWPVPEGMRLNGLIQDVLCKAVTAVARPFSRKYNVLDMYINILEVYNCVSRMVDDGVEDDHLMFVPAKDSSIRSLKRKRVEDESTNESCSICLDEFSSGSLVLCMPCSHVFHGICIQKWLRTSHYCPTCRYEMPTAN